MRAIRLTPLNRLRKTLDGHISTGVVVLAGAGVSMVPPTSLPSGVALRDHCVRCLLSDPTSRKVVQLLLHTPAFRAFLPEAVLQLMGSTVGSRLDLFIKKVLSSAAPNVVHKALVGRGYRIFTTNFDTCFEAAGGVNTRHLHGSILRLDTLQNQLYRLGKTALQETKLFARAVSGKVLLVLGYSFRDDDIVKLVESNAPAQILYLSFDGTIPPALLKSKSAVMVSKGTAQELLSVMLHPAASPLCRCPPARLPAVRHRANALLRICSRAGLYTIESRVLRAYLPRLHGRAKLLAMCEVADSLRKARQFSRAKDLADSVLSDPAARIPSSRDAVSTALVQCGLIALDRGDKDYDRIEAFFQNGLKVFEELVASEPPGTFEAENDIWRARILNNLGLVSLARGAYRQSVLQFTQSVDLKTRHHERYGVTQTYANLAKAQILQSRLSAAATTLGRLLAESNLTPDPYICADTISGCLAALRDTKTLSIQIPPEAAVTQSKRWWKHLANMAHATIPSLGRIVSILSELHLIHDRMHTA